MTYRVDLPSGRKLSGGDTKAILEMVRAAAGDRGELERLRAKLARIEVLCERWRDKRTTASAGAALRLVLDGDE